MTESPVARGKSRLLVVEDDFLIGSLLADQLRDLGYWVVGPAYSLEESRRFATDSPLDGALLDINLGRDGRSSPIAEILMSRKIPFLFVSGYRTAPDERFRDVPLLAKPFTMERLKRAVADLFREPLTY
jgi:DNA-binding response OmpR family regulator